MSEFELAKNKNIVKRENVDSSLIDNCDLRGIQFKLIAKENTLNLINKNKLIF